MAAHLQGIQLGAHMACSNEVGFVSLSQTHIAASSQGGRFGGPN
jgi:hypothetical protein